MKKCFLLMLLALFGTAANAEVLMRYSIGTGFVPNPSHSWVDIQTDGKVISYYKDLRKNQTTIRSVARLSGTAIGTITSQISDLDISNPLVDQQPGAPLCSDSPALIISVWKKGVESKIFTSSSCHDFKFDNRSGDQLIEIAKAFFLLR